MQGCRGLLSKRSNIFDREVFVSSFRVMLIILSVVTLSIAADTLHITISGKVMDSASHGCPERV
jgi:hypothetical protein